MIFDRHFVFVFHKNREEYSNAGNCLSNSGFIREIGWRHGCGDGRCFRGGQAPLLNNLQVATTKLFTVEFTRSKTCNVKTVVTDHEIHILWRHEYILNFRNQTNRPAVILTTKHNCRPLCRKQIFRSIVHVSSTILWNVLVRKNPNEHGRQNNESSSS